MCKKLIGESTNKCAVDTRLNHNLELLLHYTDAKNKARSSSLEEE